ncbi:MAG: zf-TFIIB domain-containing protein [Candidatus Marinimicrobia bacterium]|nr:zf-TFIIB domain-containing protein [Candidatus Neomarinimicrobiota bacterium]MCF7902689.1 zf-TFIIB domain-containing protein [Candidatus Neomarinimicrobiota bacterium]
MICPACNNTLTVKTIGDLEVDVCENGCGGIWFDLLELKKVDEPHESVGEGLLDIPHDPDVKVDYDAKRECPRCEGMTMLRHFYSIKRAVEIDECPNCGGIWLDAGELAQIRSLFQSEAEKKAAAKNLYNQAFDAELKILGVKAEQGTKNPESIGLALKFLSPAEK